MEWKRISGGIGRSRNSSLCQNYGNCGLFDAVSQNRCYRKAMPLQQCFDIILDGSGRDFDPLLAEIFLEIKDRVEEVYQQISDTK